MYWIVALSVVITIVLFTLIVYEQVSKIVIYIAAGILIAILIMKTKLLLLLSISSLIIDYSMIDKNIDWISPGRVLMVLSILSYILNKIRNREKFVNINVKSNLFLICMLIFLLLGLILIFGSNDIKLGIITIIKYLIMIVFTYVGIETFREYNDIKLISYSIALCFLIGSLYILIGDVAIYTKENTRLAIPGVGINAVGISLGFAVICSAGCLMIEKKLLYQAVAILSAIILIYMILRTGTRSAIVALILSGACSAVILLFKEKISYSYRVIILMIFIVSVTYLLINTNFVQGKLEERFQGLVEWNVYASNIRWYLWDQAIEIYIDNIYGVGPGNEITLTNVYGYYKESHNTFLSVLVEFGFLGLMLFLCAFFFLTLNIIKIPDIKIRVYCIWIFSFIMINALKGSMQDTRLFWIPIITVTIFSNIDIVRKK